MKIICGLLAAFIISLGSTSNAQAQAGCYTTDFYYCYSGSVTCFSLYSSNQYFYGTTVANLCASYNGAIDVAAGYLNQLNSCNSSYSALVDQYNQNVNDYNFNLGTIKALNRRITKMKKVCGAKCRKL